MNMTNKEKKLHEYITRLLKTQGSKTYARLFSNFDLNLTNNPEVIAFMEPGKGRIVVNETLDEKQISTVVRHEILHEYLKHERRLLYKLAKDMDSEIEFDDLDDLSIQELKRTLYSNKLFNIAGDYEISNRGYTEKDKENIRAILLNGEIVRGLVTEDDHPDWVDLSIEEMYDKLQEQQEEMQIGNDVLVVGISSGDMELKSFDGLIYDGTLYDPEMDRKKKRKK